MSVFGSSNYGLPHMKPLSSKRSHIVSVLDIGSTKVVCMIARLTPKQESQILPGRTHHVEIIGIGHQRSRGVKSGVIGDLDAAAAALAALQPIGNDWPETALAEHRAAFQRALRPATPGFSPHAAIDVARRALPREGVLAFDVGAHTHQTASQWTAHAPRTFLITNGWSSMGFGLPAAIAAKLARRGSARPTPPTTLVPPP